MCVHVSKCIESSSFFSGTSHPVLSHQVAKYLGIELGNLSIKRFPDGEIGVHILDNVRGRDVFVMQSIVHHPNHFLMELLIMIDAFKRASARSVAAVIPYYAYCRQDRKDRPRVPITAKLVANLLQTAGADRMIAMDLHADQLQGFFDIPVDNLYARPAMVRALQKERALGEALVLAPDVGSIKLARSFAQSMQKDLAIIDKRRMSSLSIKSATVIGDVRGKNVLMVDDICSTANTLLYAAKICKERGACRIYACVIHGLLVDGALKKLQEGPFEKVFISNTVAGVDSLEHPKLQVVSVAELFGEAILRMSAAHSISSLFSL